MTDIELKKKPSLDTFIRSCTPLAHFQPLEDTYTHRVIAIESPLLRFDLSGTPEESLLRLLRANPDFLGVVLAIANLSQEKLLRIISAERFLKGDYGNEWNIDALHSRIQNDPDFGERLIRLFLHSDSDVEIRQVIDSYYLKQIVLPTEWRKMIQDTTILGKIIRKKLAGEYSDKKGDYVENLIRHKLDVWSEKYGFTHHKGQIEFVGGKEVDHYIPAIEKPFVMMMTSYMETTSSSQTARANEQRDMYLKIQGDNQRYGIKRLLVNFVDGGGWLARRPDLRKLYDSCDFILNINTLHHLEAIIGAFLPGNYFREGAKPFTRESE